MREKTILIIVLSILASLAARTLADALHIPGFYDSIGIFIASMTLTPLYSLLASIASYLLLAVYYKVYVFALWIPVILSIAVIVVRRFEKLRYISAMVLALLYSTLWFILYMSLTHTWNYVATIFRSRGFMVLTLDALFCYITALGLHNAISKARRSTLIVSVALLIIVAAISWIAVYYSDFSIASLFPEHKGWLLFRTHKMDFVWLPLGVKGTNTYYYPIDRFKRGSPGYQVWVGMYWVQGYHDPRDVGLVSEFAKWDQNVWLGLHGCNHPYTYVDLVKNITIITFKGYKAFLMYGGMISRSDVKPYEQVTLRGFFITFYDPKTDHTAIIYACSTRENYNKMIKLLWRIVNSWRIHS